MNVKKSYPKYIASLLLFGSNGIVASHIQLTSYYIVLLRTRLEACFFWYCSFQHDAGSLFWITSEI
jgi:hypothetical protein